MVLLCNLCWQPWALSNDFSKSNLRQVSSSALFIESEVRDATWFHTEVDIKRKETQFSCVSYSEF
jgi:hypothetical protein